MKKFIAIAIIAIIAIASVFAADPAGNTVNITATKSESKVSFTLYGKESSASSWSSTKVAIGTMGDSFTVNFKVSKSESNYKAGTASMTFSVSVGELKLSSLSSGWVADKTKVAPTVGSVVGGTNSNGTITSSSVALAGYSAADDDIMTFNVTYTIPTTLQAGDYAADVTLTYTAP